MAAAQNPLPIINNDVRDSRLLVEGSAGNELVFAVVGHGGSGTSTVAKTIAQLLREMPVNSGKGFDVIILSARDVIAEWANERNKPLPPRREKQVLADVEVFQDYGDEMRNEPTADGTCDHSAVARRIILKIRAARAEATKQQLRFDRPVLPDGTHRAYVIDSIRHPAEVHLFSSFYQNAFILVGGVCEEEKRIARLHGKYGDAGRDNALRFMKRDADAKEKYGQHVADAFHLSDFFYR